MQKISRGRRVFNVANYLFLATAVLVSILPAIHILAVSFSASGPASANQVGLIPVGFTLENYRYAFSNFGIIGPFLNSVIRVLLGVSINIVLVILAAYPLSKETSDFPLRSLYAWFFIFMMMFNGGIVPTYILIKDLGLIDTVWALVLPGAVSVYFTIILLNFYRQLPRELEEAAHIDGANHFRILYSIYLPLSVPALATLTLFSTVYHWNSWFDGLIYTRNSAKYPLSTYMQVLLSQLQRMTSSRDLERLQFTSRRGLMMCYIVISLLPIMLVYPQLQKYIKTGLVLGSVKG